MVPDFLDFHRTLSNHLETREKAIWDWFRSDEITEKTFDDHRLTLLKSSVRLDAETHAGLHTVAREIADGLGIEAPVTLYQGTEESRNAALIYTPGEVNLLFQGDTLERLSPVELRALLGHEMAHYLHFTREDGRYFTADRVLHWICGEAGAHQAHARSLWLSQLYQEIHADRVAFHVCGDLEAAISLLIKVTTGLTRFSVKAYLTQAREALALSKEKGAQGMTHPETYIRAIALEDWAQDAAAADAGLAKLVEGAQTLERLDLLAQVALTELTRVMIVDFLAADWAGSDAIEAHARAFFPSFRKGEAQPADTLAPLATQSADVKDYLATVLLDFVTTDPELDDAPLLDALSFSARHGLDEALDARVVGDLGLTTKRLAALREELAEQEPPAPPAPITPEEQVLEEPERPGAEESQ